MMAFPSVIVTVDWTNLMNRSGALFSSPDDLSSASNASAADLGIPLGMVTLRHLCSELSMVTSTTFPAMTGVVCSLKIALRGDGKFLTFCFTWSSVAVSPAGTGGHLGMFAP